jgi:lysozyme
VPFPVPSPNAMRAAFAGMSALVIATTVVVQMEGEDLVAKQNPFDPKGVITACNGITNYDLPGLKRGTRFTHDECYGLLKQHLPRYTTPIDKCVKVPASNFTMAALYSASYNLGPGTVCKSSMVRKINAGDLKGGCDAFMLYVTAKNTKGVRKTLPGLVNRRTAERALCLA